MNGLIGYTGFVGSNIHRQFQFDKVFNSSNIDELLDNEYELLVCSGVRGVKWLANSQPKEDLAAIENLLGYLADVKCRKFVLISTVDVYSEPFDVDENTMLNASNNHCYGKHRAYIEEFTKEHFNDYSIIRLPALFGKGIKKNFIYDMLNNHCLEWTHFRSQFQYYSLKNIWKDINIILKNNITLVNLNSEPILAKEVSELCFGREFINVTEREPEKYNVLSIYSKYFDSEGYYIYSRSQIINDLREFIKEYNREKERANDRAI